jgi:hypothetical protein
MMTAAWFEAPKQAACTLFSTWHYFELACLWHKTPIAREV